MWDSLTLLIFLVLFLLILMTRYALSARAKRAEREAYFRQLKQMAMKEVNKTVLEHDDEIRRYINGGQFTSWPFVGKAIQRFWINLSILGWQNSWKKRAGFLFIPSLLVAVFIAKSSSSPFILAAALTLILFVLMVFIAYFRAMTKHHDEFKHNLPQAIDSIVRATRAGVPVTNTFSMVAENLPGPLAAEFNQIDNWLKVGIPLRQAMRDSAVRVPLNEYRFFVVILVINQETGGKLSDTLERLSETLRERQELALKIKAKTSEVRASATIVALLAPLSLAYMSFNSPKDFQFLIGDPTGNSVLIYAICSVSLGLGITHFMIKRVIR